LALKDWWNSLTINAVTTVILTALFGALPPAGLLLAYGLDFITAAHLIPGWAVLCSVAVAGLFVASVGLNVRQWAARRRHMQRTVQVVAQGYSTSLLWDMGTRVGPPDSPVMSVRGDFVVTNLTPLSVTVPRAVLLASYRSWYVVPRRKRVEGPGVYKPISGQGQVSERLQWEIEPPVVRRGEVLRAKVGLIDHLGRTNWGEWLHWKGLG
jgi:hypothetical protein